MQTKIILLAAIMLTVSGCSQFKSSEQQLLDLCIKRLESKLESNTKYGGWKVGKVEKPIIDIEPYAEFNAKYKTNRFMNYTVFVDTVTVKNGFNADVKKLATCEGFITLNRDGSYDPPSETLMKVYLNGEELWLF